MNSSAAEGTKPAPPDFQQEEKRCFKSKAPKPRQKQMNSHNAEMEGSDDAAVICSWEEFEEVELSDLAQYGMIWNSMKMEI